MAISSPRRHIGLEGMATASFPAISQHSREGSGNEAGATAEKPMSPHWEEIAIHTLRESFPWTFRVGPADPIGRARGNQSVKRVRGGRHATSRRADRGPSSASSFGPVMIDGSVPNHRPLQGDQTSAGIWSGMDGGADAG